MNVIYSGKTKEFTPDLEDRVAGRLARLSKFIEQRGEREAHITHCLERRQHKIKILVNFYDHALVGEALDIDLEAACGHAVCKLETQVVDLRSRWRDTHRNAKTVRLAKESGPDDEKARNTGNDAAAAEVKSRVGRRPRVHRVDVYGGGNKPMTLSEALLEMENGTEYVFYRDSNRNCLSVLVRRSDGDYDLIES